MGHDFHDIIFSFFRRQILSNQVFCFVFGLVCFSFDVPFHFQVKILSFSFPYVLNQYHVRISSFRLTMREKFLMLFLVMSSLAYAHARNTESKDAPLDCESRCVDDFLQCMEVYECSKRPEDAEKCGLYCSKYVETCMSSC